MVRPTILVFALLYVPAPLQAHGGGLNAQGCHNDRRNGGYHCHRSPSPAPSRFVSPVRSQLYANCAEARAAGVTPIRLGEAGYGRHLDRDGDGVACENSSAPAAQVAPVPRSALPVAALSALGAGSKLIAPIEGIATVLDGDTIQIGTTRIRLYGIDAFEGEQLCKTSEDNTYGCGGRATRTLTDKVESQPLTCVPKGSDAYGRTTAVCRVEYVDLSSFMVRTGHALAYTKYALDYVGDERMAKASKAGAWGGSFELPWEYRLSRPGGAAEAQRSAQAPSANCTIKGNVNKAGERIYHMPTSALYARVKPENWFCSTQEAEQAGFRRAGSDVE